MVRPFALVAAMLLVAADAKDEAKKLDGTWVMIAAEELGKPATEKEVKEEEIRFTFSDGKLTMFHPRTKPKAGTFTVDPSKEPKQIDMKAGDVEIRGIYAIDGDTLKMCLVKDKTKERPTDFTTKKGDGRGSFVFKREKK